MEFDQKMIDDASNGIATLARVNKKAYEQLGFAKTLKECAEEIIKIMIESSLKKEALNVGNIKLDWGNNGDK